MLTQLKSNRFEDAKDYSGDRLGPLRYLFIIMNKETDGTLITLTGDEALVLFEFLARFRFDKELKIIDQAEERALWNLHCLLEEKLVDPLKTEYRDLVAQAQNRLRDQLD